MDQLFIFWIGTDIPIFNKPMKFRDAVDFDQCVNSVAGLIDHEVLAAIQIVIHAGRSKYADRRQQLQHMQPVNCHRPPPAVAILRIRHHIPQIIQQHAGEALPNAQIRDFGKFYGPIIPELQLHTVPVCTGFTVPLPGFVVDPDHYLAFGTADHNRAALAGKHGFPVVGTGDEMLLLGIADDLGHIQHAGVIIKGHVQAGDFCLRLDDPGKQLVPANGRKGLEGTAALAGHLAPNAHIIPAVEVDGNGTEILAVTVTVGALYDLPRAILHAQHPDHIIRGKNL